MLFRSQVQSMNPDQWAIVMGLSFAPIPMAELQKLCNQIGERRKTKTDREV